MKELFISDQPIRLGLGLILRSRNGNVFIRFLVKKLVKF